MKAYRRVMIVIILNSKLY